MDLFWMAEWMGQQEQQRKQRPLTELRMTLGDETRDEYILARAGEEIARLDLKERGPGEVFKARVTHDDFEFYLETDSEDSNQVRFRNQNGNILEVECRGWLGNSFVFKYEEKVYSLNRRLFNRSFILIDEGGLEKGRIRAESFFSENYRVLLPETFPEQIMVFIACLVLCDSERPQMPIYNSYWYYG